MLKLFSELKGADIDDYTFPVAPQMRRRWQSSSVLPLAHLVEHARFTKCSSYTDSVWFPPFDVGDSSLTLHASLEEIAVEVSNKAHNGRVYLEDEALYWSVRTCNDTPDDIDQEAYASYGLGVWTITTCTW